LAPDATKKLTFTWGTSSLSAGDYAISAKIPPIPEETNVEDNTRVGSTVSVKAGEGPIIGLPSFSLYGFAAIVIIIVAAIVVAVYFMKFRK